MKFSPWSENTEFMSIWGEINMGGTMSLDRCWSLYCLAKMTAHRSGDFVEYGVYKGHSAYLLSKVAEIYAPEKIVHLYDTFSGIPAVSALDNYHQVGEFSDTSLELVRSRTGRNCEIHQGVIPESLVDGSLCFAHVDLDLYEPTRLAIRHAIYNGAKVILIDDYSFPTTKGAKAAADEYSVFPLETGQAILLV